MATGRKQKRNKKVSSKVGKLEKNDPLSPIDKVRTVAKPNCDQTIQAKKVSLNVKASKRYVRKEAISCESGDGTGKINFLTGGVKAKAGISVKRKGDGTGAVDFGFGEFKAKAGKADMRNGDGTHGVNFHK